MAVVGLDICLIVIIVIAIIALSEADHRLESITRLERDIYVHNMSDSEVLERLQEELIGRDVGKWLQHKVADLRKEAECLLSDIKDGPVNHDNNQVYAVRVDSYIGDVVRLIDWLNKSREGIARIRRGRIQSGFEAAIEELQYIVEKLSDVISQKEGMESVAGSSSYTSRNVAEKL